MHHSLASVCSLAEKGKETILLLKNETGKKEKTKGTLKSTKIIELVHLCFTLIEVRQMNTIIFSLSKQA